MRPDFRVLSLFTLLLFPASAFAQAEGQSPKFDVAVVKRIDKLPNPGGCHQSPVRWQCAGLLMSGLIRMAYKIERYQLIAPDWADHNNTLPAPDMYTFEAEFPAGTEKNQIDLMLQAMLADQFGLKIHHEIRETAIY